MILDRSDTITVFSEVVRPSIPSRGPLDNDEVDIFFSQLETEMEELLSDEADADLGRLQQLLIDINLMAQTLTLNERENTRVYGLINTKMFALRGMHPLTQLEPVSPYSTNWRTL